MENEKLIIELIKRYINDEMGLNSAIMINGKWGCGKTYFIKNKLGIKLKEVLKENKKKLYYITLNGLATTNDLMMRIQSIIIKENSLYSKKDSNSKTENIEIITGIDTICDEIKLQGWMNIIIGVKKKIDKKISKEKIKSSVFIFDDLERCEIPLHEILGFINDLIEHEGCKCIFVANEEEIEAQEDYKKIKEKFISRTIDFIPNLEKFLEDERKHYVNSSLGKLSQSNWDKIITNTISRFDINLRTIQSCLYIVNKVYDICIKRLLEEDMVLMQIVLDKLLTDIFTVEKYYKSGNLRPENKNDGKGLGVYTLKSTNKFPLHLNTFNFIFDIVYDGLFNEEIILNDINNYIESIKIKGKLSPITELKEYYFMEDKDIQDQLDLIYLTIDELSLKQISDFLNFLIPLLDLGFTYNQFDDFDNVLDLVLKDIKVSSDKSDYSFEIVDYYTSLKGDQKEKYILAMEKVKSKLQNIKKLSNQYIQEFLNKEDWLEQLKIDMEKNEYKYKEEKKYLSYFDLDILINRLEKSTNKELADFRNLLYSLYGRHDCIDSFQFDVEVAKTFISKLEHMNPNGKINKLTVNYIIGDLETSFVLKGGTNGNQN